MNKTVTLDEYHALLIEMFIGEHYQLFQEWCEQNHGSAALAGEIVIELEKAMR